MNVNIRQLKIFEATARLGRLTLAAADQSISQSAASQALKELQGALGYPLFNRVGRELVITQAGRQVLPQISQILQLVDGLRSPDPAALSGTLRVTASVTIACYLLPRLLAEFGRRHPAVEPALAIANTSEVLAQLERGQAHVGLIEGPALHQRLQVRPWREDHLEVFCHPEHPLARRGRLDIAQIAEQRWVLREPGSGTRAIFDAAVQQLGAQLKLALELNRQEAIKQSVKAGLGIGCLSQLAIAEEVAAGELVILQTPMNLRRRLSLVTQPRELSSTLGQAFSDFLGAAEPTPPGA
ncbi:LysR family transcriptional regulator [Pseudomonas lalucatii]|uniref:LysR family transcriptional regulator n=1 Tax=Pseudomonas lalucatii TaxID=1424203 RepID=A0ABS5Q066_9PSED|nr:LysR substrate-binding domain-containing protein [Pseudomonas lalucatii]MBS7662132.1 LysR family transcriptional regulator [Pseudomonas lalucatii]